MSAPLDQKQLTAAAQASELPAPRVSVLLCRELLGWPEHERGGKVSVVALHDALGRSYPSNAHFTSYVTPNGRRLNVTAVDRGVAPKLDTIAFDLDCAAVHGTDQPAPDDWRAAVLERFADLLRVHPGLLLYMTRGGARIVARLRSPTVIASRADALLWRQAYQITIACLARRFGLQCDPACDEWNRLFRLPHATRDGHSAPEAWEIHGDPAHVGVLSFAADERDIEAARRAKPSVFGVERTARVLQFAPAVASGLGLLYHLLAARGAIVCEHGVNAFVVRCPNEATHTTGCTGDGSTLLYAPALGEEIGALHCKHAHCAGLRVRDWLAMFTTYELGSARRAAGVRGTA